MFPASQKPLQEAQAETSNYFCRDNINTTFTYSKNRCGTMQWNDDETA